MRLAKYENGFETHDRFLIITEMQLLIRYEKNLNS